MASKDFSRASAMGLLAQIIKAGGDTDTIASMAGQIAGARLGFSRLPSSLLERLPEREMILDVAHRFAGGILKTGLGGTAHAQ